MRDLVRGRPRSHGARQAPLRGTMASKIGARLGLIVLLRRSRSGREQGPSRFPWCCRRSWEHVTAPASGTAVAAG
jgi:hypothetical protein